MATRPSTAGRRTRMVLLAAALAAFVVAAAAGRPARSAAGAGEGERLFLDKVQPLLRAKCFPCHGDDPKKIRGAFDMRTRAGLLKGGESGDAALVPGAPDKSPLYVAVTRKDEDFVMPPKENDKLSDGEVAAIRAWIAAGAPWPVASLAATAVTGGVPVPTTGGRSPDWTNRRYNPEDLWAYRPITRPAVPEDRDLVDPAARKSAIDAFIQARLRAKGIKRLAPRADRRTLIRRVTFDLTGLPPTPDDVEAFARDDAPDAFERLVDGLLESPHYGEQAARHWLDVVRYADTGGFANDFERPNAWRYRDYVIRSFNSDKPFDRFVLEQVAGDELAPEDPEALIAVGFLRMGPWEHTGMTVAAVTRQQFLDDVTHGVGVSMLGQGLRCAACHDHKFDPVPTKDYYSVQAVFASTQFAERDVGFLRVENVRSFDEGRAAAARRIREVEEGLAALAKKRDGAIASFVAQHGRAAFDEQMGRSNRGEFGLSRDEVSERKRLEKRRAYFERELKRYEPYALSVYSGRPNQYSSQNVINPMPEARDGAVPAVHILLGGSLESPGEPVAPGVLSGMAGVLALSPPASTGAYRPAAWSRIPDAPAGRRLAFARWIASPANTLTARVIVNRLWQSHFGRGLVATPNNFGKMGARPTHPELLDWLARWFLDQGWSLKKLHRLIVTSETYQQAGEHPDAETLRRLDPKNELCAFFPPRRLAAEEIRDSLLAVSGELNREAGGPGVSPEINWEVALQPRHIMGSVAPAYEPTRTRRERNRRTIYAFRYRTLADPMLEVFNRPVSETSCERRDETTVTPQAFALMNGEAAQDRALAMAAALEAAAPTLGARIERAFRLVYGRPPTAAEGAQAAAHVAKLTRLHERQRARPRPLPTTVKRHMIEEMTGESVRWEESLTGVRGYERDLKPWDVGARTRALADLCLVLMNSNEFLYLR